MQPADQLDSDTSPRVPLLPAPGCHGLSALGKASRSQDSGPIPNGKAQVPAKLHLLRSTSPGAVCAGKKGHQDIGTSITLFRESILWSALNGMGV